MFKKISLLLLSLFTLFSIIIPIITFSNKNNEEIVNINSNRSIKDNYFYEYIKDSATNGVPNIFYTWDASLPLIEFFLLSIGSLWYNIENNNKIEMDIFFNILLKNSYNRFNMNEIGKYSKQFDSFSEINIHNISYLNFFNNDKSNHYDILDEIPSFVSKMNIEKFDFIIPDGNFREIIINFLNGKSDILEFILKKSNKILILSDGAYHTKTYIPFLIDLLKSYSIPNNEIIKENFKNFINNKVDLSKELILQFMSMKNYLGNLNDSKFHFISHINYDSYQNTIKPYWNVNVFDTSFYNYAQYLFTKETTKNKFLKTFSNLFLFNINSMNDIMINGYDTYDKNKRNAIFLGSSLFIKDNNSNITRLENFPNVTLAVRKQMDQFLNKYPSDQYNIIFKLHPIYNGENAIKYIQYITDNKIINPIIINPKIPLEVLMANDYYWYKDNLDNSNLESFIFRENEIYSSKEWTTYFGLQPSTTAIHTTRLFYESVFNTSKHESASLISMENFPIPVMFSTLDRLEKDNINKNYYNENIKIINDIYKYYNPSIYFDNSSLVNEDGFIINNVSKGIDLISIEFNNYIYIIVIPIIILIVFIIIIYRKQYRKNLLKSYKRIKLIKT